MLGRLDVAAMLDEIEPCKFDEWIAYMLLETSTARSSAMICATLHNETERALIKLGKTTVGDADLHSPADYLPGDQTRKPDRANGRWMTPDQFAQQLQQRQVPHVDYR